MEEEIDIENLFGITKELRNAILEFNQYGELNPRTIKNLKELFHE